MGTGVLHGGVGKGKMCVTKCPNHAGSKSRVGKAGVGVGAGCPSWGHGVSLGGTGGLVGPNVWPVCVCGVWVVGQVCVPGVPGFVCGCVVCWGAVCAALRVALKGRLC